MIFGSLYLPDENIINVSEETKIKIDKKNKCLKFQSVNSDTVNVDFKEIDDIDFMEYCYFPQNKSLILGDLYGFTIYHVSFRDGNTKEIDKLNRKENDDRGFCQIKFIEISTGCICVYESGVLCLDIFGSVMWHNKHQRYDWVFTGIENGFVMYESEDDGNWCYSLNDGRKMEQK